jgi:hypothetical protein
VFGDRQKRFEIDQFLAPFMNPRHAYVRFIAANHANAPAIV